ncbi:MAG TPA: hypothetical protein VH186_03535 [Chloroflexia bacterium]|nr:hypothetical protein [Chloroflexia bacterium]
MEQENPGDKLNRIVKLALDDGSASSLAEAEKIYQSYRLVIIVGEKVKKSPTLQAAALTAINIARRSMLGGVEVYGNIDFELLVPWRKFTIFKQAVFDLGGKPVMDLDPIAPKIIIGLSKKATFPGEFVVRATFDGWIGGVVPVADRVQLAESQEFVPAGVLAGALGVSEAFQYLRKTNPYAGERAVGLSLWQPGREESWLEINERGPQVTRMPSSLWLIGLGHLGQAFLWILGLLPYANPQEVNLVLQDFDTLVPANDSTSLLTRPELIGLKKTRAMAAWCEERGFRTVIQERRFSSNFQVYHEEPQVAICGVDNSEARAALEEVGFKRIIEAGLGTGTKEYLAFQLHSFPSSIRAKERWGGRVEVKNTDFIRTNPAYQVLAAEGMDECGLTLLAGRSVGASFVGVTTATLIIAELLRMIEGKTQFEVIDGSLNSLNNLISVENSIRTEAINPGFTLACK